MLGDVIHKAKELLQSDHEVKLKNFMASFNFISIPEGGARSVCRDKLSILNKNLLIELQTMTTIVSGML